VLTCNGIAAGMRNTAEERFDPLSPTSLPPLACRRVMRSAVTSWPDVGEAQCALIVAGPEEQENEQRLGLVLQNARAWQLSIHDPAGKSVGFVRATSDHALNGQPSWDRAAFSRGSPQPAVRSSWFTPLSRLKKETSVGLQWSVAAPRKALQALQRCVFLVIRAGSAGRWTLPANSAGRVE